jgi:hypothetical protein
MQYVLLKDFEDYLKFRINRSNKKLEEIYDEIEDDQKEYEKTFTYKIMFGLFGLKGWEKVSYPMFHGLVWRKTSYEDYVSEIQIKLLKLEYNRKSLEMNNAADIDSHPVENTEGDTFYIWAKDNKRPY